MKRDLSLWQFAGFCLTSLGGTLLHFLYEWTDGAVWAAPFSGVNESTWEHMKLLYFPLFLFALIQHRFFRDRLDFWCVKWAGISAGLLLIPLLFYTYNGALGKSPDWVNIAIFFVSTAAAFLLETHLFRQGRRLCRRPRLAFFALCLVGVLFIFFTFFPLPIPLFRDPLSGQFGRPL